MKTLVPIPNITSQTRLPRVLQLMIVGLCSLTIACFASIVACSVIFKFRTYPYNTPFLNEFFPDFLLFRSRFAYFHTPAFFSPLHRIPFMYPAPVAVVYKLFYQFGQHALRIFLLFTASIFTASGLLFGRALSRRGVSASVAYLLPLLVLLCCYPIWYTIKQANMEVITWLLVTAGLFCFLRNKNEQAAVYFALAGAFKIYPILYLALLLVRQRYRAVGIGLLAAVLATLLSLWAVGHSIVSSQHEISKGLDTFRSLIMLHKMEPQSGFDHSLFALLKYCWRPYPTPERLAPVLSMYLLCAAVLICGFFFLRVRRLPVLNQITFLTVSAILFPPTSFEYTLTHLLFPLGCMALLLTDGDEADLHLSPLTTAIFTIMLLIAPLPELIIRQHRIDGPFKCVLLTGLWILTITRPLELTPNRSQPPEGQTSSVSIRAELDNPSTA